MTLYHSIYHQPRSAVAKPTMPSLTQELKILPNRPKQGKLQPSADGGREHDEHGRSPTVGIGTMVKGFGPCALLAAH
jgi:hypothetical protein